MTPKKVLAVWAAKTAIRLARLGGSGGSTFPGRVARKVDSGLLRSLASQHRRGNVVISGTNGKTTTAKMISDIVTRAGWRPAHNRTGANLIYGITSEFARQSSLWGRMPTDVGLCEVDEATMPIAVRELSPRIAVVTNFFRDQLDRFGELDTTVSHVRKGLDLMKKGAAVLNSDDPLVAGLASSTALKTIFYGVEDRSVGAEERAHVQDITRCSVCGAEYKYSSLFYAHLGLYKCPGCGRERPRPDVGLVKYQRRGERGSSLRIDTPGGVLEFDLRLPGVYNAYNALAAVSCGIALGIPLDIIRAALIDFSSSFGRMELITIGDKKAFIALVKNPTGFNEVIRTLLEGEDEKRLIIAINDKYADGTDISWLWDVDFERLASSQDLIDFIIASGIRADDMAVRLKYAGVDTTRTTVIGDIGRAIRAALDRMEPGGLVYVLPTYTAMLEVRDVLHKMGYARQFWEV